MVETAVPRTLKEALEFRSRTAAVPFAGGTDLMVKYRQYGGQDPRIGGAVLFLGSIPEMNILRIQDDDLVIGASVTLSRLLENLDPALPPVLAEAVRTIGAPGLRNRATLAGNIANASPAGDSLPALTVLNTRLVLESLRGQREIPLEDFITGPGKTVLAADEIIREIRIPAMGLSGSGGYYFRKVGTRKANALAKLSLAAYWNREAGIFRMAAGAVGPRIVRFIRAEETVLSGETSASRIREICDPLIVPIDDQRSTAVYRKTVCLNLIELCLTRYLEEL